MAGLVAAGGDPLASSPSTRAKRRQHRRVTRHESRYHSEVRQEAVQQALAAMQGKVKPSMPMPSRRTSVMAKSPTRERRVRRRRASDSTSEDDYSSEFINDSSDAGPDRTLAASRPFYAVEHSSDTSMTDSSTTSSPAHDMVVPPSVAHYHHNNHHHQQQQVKQHSAGHQRRDRRDLRLREHLDSHHNQQQHQQRLSQLNQQHHNRDHHREHHRGDAGRRDHHREREGSRHSQYQQREQVTKGHLQVKQHKERRSHHQHSNQHVPLQPSVSELSQFQAPLLSREERPPPAPPHFSHQSQLITSSSSSSSAPQIPVQPPPPLLPSLQVPTTQQLPQLQQQQQQLPCSQMPSRRSDQRLPLLPDQSVPSQQGNLNWTGSGGSQGSAHSSGNTTSSSNGGLAPEKPPERISSRTEQITINQLADVMQNLSTSSLVSYNNNQPDVTRNNVAPPPLPPRVASVQNNSGTNGSSHSGHDDSGTSGLLLPDYDTVYGQQLQADQDGRPVSQSYDTSTYSSTGTGRWKVSAKIQQLLNTLKRPKKKPLPDFYVDDDADLEVAANSLDPAAPRPEGSTMVPCKGEQLSVPSGLPKSLEAALQRYGSATFKAPAVTVLDNTSKINAPLTYGKLYSRSRKIAYNLLNRVGQKGNLAGSGGGEVTLKPGDRVALVFPNNDPIGFMCSFYGCLTAGVVPVAVEMPVTRKDAGSQAIGFLLGSCNVTYALTSEACFKTLPRTSGSPEVHPFKGWPKLFWLTTESWSKPSKDWQPPSRICEETPAYIEYTVDKDGSMKGVSVSRAAMISHSRALTSACGYTEGDLMVSVLDFKREVGLWHSVLASVLNGMHVVFVPYSLMKVNPSSWMLMITKFKATVAVCKSRDLHWGLLATRDHKDVNLSSLRMLLVADGSNPWSLSSCDQFVNVFNSRGLKPEAICPCAVSAEGLTVAVRRPGRTGVGATGRGVLSMSALSYGVIRVDQENSLTSLTLQDCGHILSGAVAAVVKINGSPNLCKTDEVGEICIQSPSTGSSYWGLTGLTNSVFRCQPLNDDDTMYNRSVELQGKNFIRTGLLGFVGPGSLVFVCGSRDGLMQVSGRKHNTDDLIATVLAVEPMKFVYRGRIAIFSIRVLRDERICVIAEQRPDCSEEESFQWMSRVLQAVDSIHQVGIYCLALVPPNYLPKTPLGGIHLAEVKRRFLEGSLHPANVLMCPHTCVTNLPKPREAHPEIGPASVMVGNIVQGNRLAVAQGREVGQTLSEDSDMSDFGRKYQFIGEILKWRATSTPDHNMFTLLNCKGTESVTISCSGLYKKAERVAVMLLERGRLNTGDHVALIYPPGIDLIAAFYGCLYVGVVPVTIRPPQAANLQTTLPTVRMIVDVSKSVLILSTQHVIKLLKSKEAGNVVDIKTWVPALDTDDLPKKKMNSIYRAPTAEMIAYLDFSVSTTGMLAGIKVSHAAATALCRSMKLACELYPSRHIALCLDPYCGLGFILWCLNSVYSGHHTILIPPSEVEANPSLWLTTVSQYKVRDTFCSYGIMELCTKELGHPNTIQQLKQRNVSLSCVRTCVVVAEERPRVALTTSFSKLFSSIGLSPRAVSTTFGCRVNVGLCLQGASSPDPTTVFVDMRALRNDRVTLVERGAPHSLCVTESGKLLPGVKVVIANPDTKGHCGDSNLGEIWVQSPFNASGYFTVYGDDSLHNDHFNARLTTGDTSQTYARTGYLGFLRRTESVQADGELHDAVFVVGALDETVMLRGMRYHPIDVENSVLRSHKKIAECAVFTWTNLLVVVCELDGNENEALDLVPLVTNAVLEEHHLIVGVVVVVDPSIVPINSRGEKQRMHLRDGFLADQLDPIYVAYNM
ncbi:Disco-interacting protein 2 [Halotydeus destructor]|nr:Disco-interacting protein 2 [Halotydeus destructor]